MRLLKSFLIACSMYSAIPVPQFEWKEKDMKYMLCFFPWIGAVIGVVLYFATWVCNRYHAGVLCTSFFGAAIPLIVTGGFHVDGFMDTMDAFHSYQSREKKLEILKDPHIGAFSVIMLALYGLLYIAAFSEVNGSGRLAVVCSGFFLTRCLSGLAVVSFSPAKQEGMLYRTADNAQKGRVRYILAIEGISCIAFMLWQSFYTGLVVAATALILWGYYYKHTKKELGGITGDTAGYFVCLCEAGMMIAAAGCSHVWF